MAPDSTPGVVAALAIPLALLLASPAPGQGVQRFDMGSATSALASGFTRIEPATLYAATRGHGWTSAPRGAYARPAPVAEVEHNLPVELIRDGCASTADCSFRVDLPAGRYHCVAYLGDLGAPGGLRPLATPRSTMDILAGGVEVVSDAFARTVTAKASFDGAWGGYKRVSFLCDVPADHLELTFHVDRGRSNAIMGLEVYPQVAPPIRFDHASSALVAQGSSAALLGPALAAFNRHDYAAARALLDAVPDDLARAWGYAWWIGWLKGREADADEDLLAQTRSLLEGLNAPDNPAVAGLLAEVKDFQKGLLFNRIRGYSSRVFPASLDNIVANLCAAVQHFEQMDDDLLGTPSPASTESPLFAKAQFLIARNLYSRNTKIGDPATPYNLYWLGILQNLFAPHGALFPRAANLRVFTWFAANYAMTGGLIKNWPGPTSLPPINPASTWWAAYTEVADPPAAPAWANAQRRYVRAYRNAGRWWMEKRLLDGEMGGGGGDDVEGAGVLSLPTIVRSEPGNPLERGVRTALDKVLFGPEVDQDQGYFRNCGDVEHAGEYTTNPLFALLPTNYGNPRYLEFAMRTIRNMDELKDPAPWTQLVAPGKRHFRAFRFGARSICGPARDIPLDMRAIIPGFTLLDYSANPRTAQLFDELARAWAENAMSSAQGKPRGIFPGSVSTAYPPVFGTGGSWWKNGGYIDLPGGANYHPYLYSLLLAAYFNSSANDRHIFLEPVYHAALLVHEYLLGNLSGASPGQPLWTAETLKGAIARSAASARGALASDPTLALGPPELARIDAVIDAHAPAYERYMNQAGPGPKDKSVLVEKFHAAAEWMRYFWVLATSSVSYTDRIYAIAKGGHQLQYSCVSGGGFDIVPRFPITWSNPDPGGGELDVAILVNAAAVDSLDILLFNFESRPRAIDLRIWRLLELGDYEIRIGDDADHDDVMDGPPHTRLAVRFEARGATFSLPPIKPGVLQLIRLVKTASLPPAARLLPDLALCEQDVQARPDGTLDVVVHNLGSAPVPPGALVELRAGGVLLGSRTLGRIDAPLDLDPRSLSVNFPYQPGGPAEALALRLVPPAGLVEITTSNNEVELVPALPDPALTIAPGGSFGLFDVAITSPFDAGDFYWIASSWSGTSPGIPLPSPAPPGYLILPLVLDPSIYLGFQPELGVFRGALGLLDGSGAGLMQASVPRLPATLGLTLYFAAATADLGGAGFRAVSSPVRITLR